MTDAPEPAGEPDDVGSATRVPGPGVDEHDEHDEPRRWRRTWVRAAVVAGVALAAAAGLWGLSQRSSGGDPDLAEARDVAGRFGAAYLTFDAATVNDAGEELLALATERFAREFEAARLPGVEALFAGTDTATAAEVTDVFMTTIEDERVRALVFVDIDATGPEGAQRLVNLSFIVELVASDGTWRVDAVAPVPFPEVVGAPGTGGSSTTTVSTADTTPSTNPPAAPTEVPTTGP